MKIGTLIDYYYAVDWNLISKNMGLQNENNVGLLVHTVEIIGTSWRCGSNTSCSKPGNYIPIKI